VQFLAEFVAISVECNTWILTFYEDLVGPDNIVSIYAKVEFFSNVLNQLFRGLILQQNIDFLCDRILIFLTKVVNTSA